MTNAIQCSQCNKKMFAQAKVCPHCGARQQGQADAPTKLSREEASALLDLHAPPPRDEGTMGWVKWLLGPRRPGNAELVLSGLALPLTVFTLLTTGMALTAAARWRREVRTGPGQRVFSVLGASGFAAVTLWQVDAEAWAWGVLGASFTAWLIREIRR